MPCGCPAITVVVVPSHTVQADSSSVNGLAMTAGAPGMPNSGPRLALSISAASDDFRARVAAGDQARRRQIQDGMQGVTHADVQCAGLAGHDDRRIAQPGVRPQERQNGAHRDHDNRQYAPCDERKRLCPHRIVQHADVSAQQRVLHPAYQKSIPADLQPGCRLTSHTPPAPSLTAVEGPAFHQFGVRRFRRSVSYLVVAPDLAALSSLPSALLTVPDTAFKASRTG